MDTDIRDELDRCFGDGPATTPDLPELLARGRRSLRRRRAVEGGAVLGVAAVVVTGALVAVGGPATRSAPDPALPGPSTAVETPTDTPTTAKDPAGDLGVTGSPKQVVIRTDPSLTKQTPVMIDNNGVVDVMPDVDVIRTVANPFARRPPTHSAALVFRLDGTTYWWVGFSTAEGNNSTASQPVREGMDFDSWLARQAPIQGDGANDTPAGVGDGGDWPGRVDLQLVRFGLGEQLVPLDGARVLQQRQHPALPESWALPSDASAVAEVTAGGDRYYVLARRGADGSPAQYIAVEAAEGGATLDAFLDFARERYAEGGGGLL